MKYEVFYEVENFKDSLIIEAENIDDIRKKTTKELELRNATYDYSNWLEN